MSPCGPHGFLLYSVLVGFFSSFLSSIWSLRLCCSLNHRVLNLSFSVWLWRGLEHVLLTHFPLSLTCSFLGVHCQATRILCLISLIACKTGSRWFQVHPAWGSSVISRCCHLSRSVWSPEWWILVPRCVFRPAKWCLHMSFACGKSSVITHRETRHTSHTWVEETQENGKGSRILGD